MLMSGLPLALAAMPAAEGAAQALEVPSPASLGPVLAISPKSPSAPMKAPAPRLQPAVEQKTVRGARSLGPAQPPVEQGFSPLTMSVPVSVLACEPSTKTAEVETPDSANLSAGSLETLAHMAPPWDQQVLPWRAERTSAQPGHYWWGPLPQLADDRMAQLRLWLA